MSVWKVFVDFRIFISNLFEIGISNSSNHQMGGVREGTGEENESDASLEQTEGL